MYHYKTDKKLVLSEGTKKKFVLSESRVERAFEVQTCKNVLKIIIY